MNDDDDIIYLKAIHMMRPSLQFGNLNGKGMNQDKGEKAI